MIAFMFVTVCELFCASILTPASTSHCLATVNQSFCKGCIDLTNPANFGLESAISALDPIVAKFENKAVGVSRADLWALAVMAGSDAADHGTLSKPINFTQNWFGRVNCEDAGQVCRNNVGQPVPCSSTVGPNRRMAEPTLNSDSIFTYFADEFAFNQRQVIAIMGAHSVGRLSKAVSDSVLNARK